MSKSKYPAQVQRTIASAYKAKLSTLETAKKINHLKSAEKSGLVVSRRSIATIFGNITRGRCSWFYRY